MDKPAAQWAADALTFLGRAQLQGNEVARFIPVAQHLEALANGTLMAVPVKQETTEPPIEAAPE